MLGAPNGGGIIPPQATASAGIGVWDSDLEGGTNFGGNRLMQTVGVTRTAMPAAGNNTVSPPSFARDRHASDDKGEVDDDAINLSSFSDDLDRRPREEMKFVPYAAKGVDHLDPWRLPAEQPG